jgi:Flp pilus assembly pilin Flp
LIATIISIVVVGSLTTMGTTLRTFFNSVVAAL